VKRRTSLSSRWLAFASTTLIATAKTLAQPAEIEPILVEPATGAPESEPEAIMAPEDIIVTGTRIRPRSEFGTAAAVDIIDRERIDRSGVQTLQELVQYLTTTQGTGTLGMTNFGGPSGQAASAINLRGLGPGATLLLLNGRRLNPSGAAIVYQHFSDLSLVPLAAVDRVEILRAGASAIYGADAVGGVVNIITRRNWSGARLQGDGRTTQHFDHGEYTASTSVGSISERAHVLLAVAYNRRTELTVGERDWPDAKYRSTLSYPGSFATLAGDVMTDPACGTVLGSERVPGPGGQGELCSVPYGDNFPLINNGERIHAFGSAAFDLTDHTMFFSEALFSHFRTDNIQVPSFPIVPPFPIVPADHIENPYRQPLLYIGAPLGADSGSGRDSGDDDSFHGVVGIRGDLEDAAEGTFLESWEWELSASLGFSRYRESDRDTLRPAFQEALNSCSDPAHLEGCFNPFYSASDGSGRPNPQAVIDGFRSDQVLLADHSLQTYNAGVTGALFELPGGDVGLAFGGELRREWRTHRLDHDSNQLNYALLLGNANSAAARNVYSAYLELRWPVYHGIELQTAGRLEHYTDTDTTPLSPFAGLTITPSELFDESDLWPALHKLQLRGNLSRAFRAPTIFNTFAGIATLPTPVTYRGQPLYAAVQLAGNPELEPETAWTWSAGLLWAPMDEFSITGDYWAYDYKGRIQGEDPQQFLNLQENNLAMGLPGDPHVVTTANGDLQSITVSTINATGSVVTTGIDFAVNIRLNGATFGAAADSFGEFELGIEGTYTLTYDVPRRMVGLRSLPDGSVIGPKDCEGSAAVDLDGDPENDAQNDQDTCHVAGRRNVGLGDPPAIPRLRANLPLTWSYAGHSLTAITHIIGELADDAPPLEADGGFETIPAWITLDLQYGFLIKDVIGKEFKLRVGCMNVFNRLPPVANGTDPAFVLDVHDPRGRMFYASLSSEF
jgi:iron complex outermembrane recepter protein